MPCQISVSQPKKSRFENQINLPEKGAGTVHFPNEEYDELFFNNLIRKINSLAQHMVLTESY